MLRRLIPYHTDLEETPLYQESAYPLPHRFSLWTLMLITRVVVIVLLVYGFFYIDDWLFDGRLYVSGNGVFLLFVLSVGVMVYADYAGVRSGLKTARDGLAAGKSKIEDILISPAEKTTVYHAVARLNVWRLTMGIVGLRLVVAVLALLELYEQFSAEPFIFFGAQNLSQAETMMRLSVIYVLMGLTLVLYVIEPCVRLWFTTAFGVATATRSNREEESILNRGGVLSLAGYWGLLYISFILVTSLISRQTGWYGVPHQWLFGTPSSMLGFLSALGLTLLIYLYQYRFTLRLLKQAEMHLSAPYLTERRKEIVVEQAFITPQERYYPLKQRLFAWQPLLQMMESSNPVFEMESRQMKRGGNLRDLRRVTVRVIFRLCLVTAILALGMFLLRYRDWLNFYSTYNSSYYGQPLVSWQIFELFIGSFVLMSLILAGASIGGSLFLDFSCLSAGMNSINRDMVAGRWDLLRLSMLSEQEILTAKHAITQIRAWRTLVWISGMRVLSLLLLAVLLFIRTPYPGALSPAESMLYQFIQRPVLVSLIAFGTIGFLVVYLLEPFWRFQAVTAMALSVSAGRNPTNSILMGLGAILGMWISQAVVLFFLWFMMLNVAQIISGLFWAGSSWNYELMGYIQTTGVVIACFITGVVIFLYYSLLQRFNMSRLRAQAFKA